MPTDLPPAVRSPGLIRGVRGVPGGGCRRLLSLYALQPFGHDGSAGKRLDRGVMRHTDLSAGTLAESPYAETVGPKWVHSVERACEGRAARHTRRTASLIRDDWQNLTYM